MKQTKNILKFNNKFIEKQNGEIQKLLENKINDGIFSQNCKERIKIIQIKEEDIFTFNPKEKFSFIDIVFDSSYRKIIDSKDYIDYKEYEINLDFIEENMTNLLLNNKKLLTDKIFEFS